jgi:1-aminocyclopropane-1-carboxylate deaminase
LDKQVSVSVLRLDTINPMVSGNKLFKLHYFLEDCMASDHKTLLTFGGTWSNHLVATAYAGSKTDIRTIGIIRGERPAILSTTLLQCLEFGMQLKFVSRSEYTHKSTPEFVELLSKEYGSFILVPEGGFDFQGARGAALIMDLITDTDYTHVCTACGTATTLAGLMMGSSKNKTIVGVSVLKGDSDIEERLTELLGEGYDQHQLQMLTEYHFGGYAKKTDQLIEFMNHCWKQYQLPLDFVYTAKMFYAIMESIRLNHFLPGSKIICLHTGGLQGNRSLPVETLLY